MPLDFPDRGTAKFHLIVVAHGISTHVARYFGKGATGSLLINSELKGPSNHTRPFYIGDLDPNKPFVHVFDDDSLQTVMETVDTVSDFIRYLVKREKLLRRPITIVAPGEEELLAVYLSTFSTNGEHDILFPVDSSVSWIGIDEGEWENFQKHPQRRAQLEEDKISYSWDALIEKFNHYALKGEQHFVTSGGLKDAELVLRFMAKESRFMRRVLAKGLHEMLLNTPKEKRGLRLLLPTSPGLPCYVFLLFPPREHIRSLGIVPPTVIEVTDEEYRNVRVDFLRKACLVARMLHLNWKTLWESERNRVSKSAGDRRILSIWTGGCGPRKWRRKRNGHASIFRFS
jgi:hypothetical protein